MSALITYTTRLSLHLEISVVNQVDTSV